MSSFQTDYVYTKISKLLFERLREDAGPYGPSVNQRIQKMLDVTQRYPEVWVARVKSGLPNHLGDLVGMKVTSEQYEELVKIQNRLKENNLFVPISDLICGRYLRAIWRREGIDSWAQLVNEAFPNQGNFIELYVLKEDESLVCVSGGR